MSNFLKKIFGFFLFCISFYLFFYSFLFSNTATIDKSNLEIGKEYSVTIFTGNSVSEPSTWREEVREVAIVMPGCSVTDIVYKSPRSVTAKVKVIETSKYIGYHNNTSWNSPTAYGIITTKYDGGAFENTIVDNSTKFDRFTYTILSKPEVMNCIPSASYINKGRENFILEGRFFKPNDDIDFSINGSGIKLRAKSSDFVIAYSSSIPSVSSSGFDQNDQGVNLAGKIAGGPYSITGIGSDGGKGESYDFVNGAYGAKLFTLYPSPSITSVSNNNHYQGEEDVSFSIYGNGFYNDPNGQNSSYYQVINNYQVINDSGDVVDVVDVVQGVRISIEDITPNEISGNISISENVGNNTDVGLGIRVINPDGKNGLGNVATFWNAIRIEKKIIPKPIARPSGNDYDISLETGFNGACILLADNGSEYGFEKHEAPIVTSLAEGITISESKFVNSKTLILSLSVNKNLEVGNYFLSVQNPTWKGATGYWEIKISSSSKSKLNEANVVVYDTKAI